MTAFLRLADELAPAIAKGQKLPVSSAKISAAIADAREEHDGEVNG